MGCDVYVYDSGLSPLTSSSIEIVAKDYSSRSRLVTIQNNKNLGGSLYGANLIFSTGKFSYLVAVDDTTAQYGPATLFPLNGNEPGRLDMVLYPTPQTGGSGPYPTTTQQIASYIARQSWSLWERISVHMLIAALSLARQGWDPSLAQMWVRWERKLERLGISPHLI